MVEVQKPMVFFAISAALTQPSVGIGVVEVQKPIVFLRFPTCPRDPLRGSAWSRCKNPWFFCDFHHARATLCGDRRGRGTTHGFLRFPTCPRDPLRGSAWLKCKNPWFLRFPTCPRNPLRDRRGRGAKTRGFLRLLLFELVLGSCLVVRAPAPGTGRSQVRFLPGPRAGVARCNLHFKATCAGANWSVQVGLRKLLYASAVQVALRKLLRASCSGKLAPASAL